MDYDTWKLSPPEEPIELGTEDGDLCNRCAAPDEDNPKPLPCTGTMHYADVENCSCHINPPCSWCENNPLVCDTCGEEA